MLNVHYCIVGLTMSQIELNKKAAYALGFYHALYDGFQHNPFMDQYYNEYKKGYDAGISEYCMIEHPDEVNA